MLSVRSVYTCLGGGKVRLILRVAQRDRCLPLLQEVVQQTKLPQHSVPTTYHPRHHPSVEVVLSIN